MAEYVVSHEVERPVNYPLPNSNIIDMNNQTYVEKKTYQRGESDRSENC